MRGSKYTYKNKIPKQFRKGKVNSFQQAKRKMEDKIELEGKRKPHSYSPINKRSISPFRKKRHYIVNKNKQERWKLPSFILILALFTIILILPTLIVGPFIKKDDNEISSMESTTEAHIEEVASPFSVGVMRSGSEDVVNIPLEDYVVGVVASEMPVAFEVEALKAQALAARTYIVNHLLYNPTNEESAVTDTVQHQVYKSEEELMRQWGPNDYNEKIEKITKAVQATHGQILTYENEPITPAFFSTSNGYTENSEDYWKNELPYLRSVESTWDKESPKFLDQKIFTIIEIEDALSMTINQEQTVPITINRTESNRVSSLQLAGQEFTGREIREKLQLQSSDFSIEQNNDHLIFTTKGYGHGVGMSQYGANGMAKEGRKYEEIVSYFYQDVNIKDILDVAPTLVAK